MLLQRTCLVVLVIIQTAFLVLLLAGHEPWAGPTIVALSPGHGVHVTDIPLLALWLIGLLATVTIWRSGRD